MRTLLSLASVVAVAALASASDPDGLPVPHPKVQKHAERAPTPLLPGCHDCVRAGTCQPMSRIAVPSVNSHYGFGYVGGSSPIRGVPKSNYDSLNVKCDNGSYGTFGTDYVGFGHRPGRIFLGFFDKPHAKPLTNRYKSDGPKLTDPVAAQPFKKSVKEAVAEHKEGGHGEGGEKH